MPAIPISYSEIYGVGPTEPEFSELIKNFKTQPSFVSLSMWTLMISLFEGQAEKYKQLQGFFIHNLIRAEVRDRVSGLAALSSESARPVFGRWQLLALMKKVVMETTNDGIDDPRHDFEARQRLGDACLMMNDLLFSEEQDERLSVAAGDREKVGDELMAQMLFQFELYHVPDVYQAVARNLEYFDIFEQRAAEFLFSDAQTLPQKFAALTGLQLPHYLEMYFSIWTLHNSFQQGDPLAINASPGIINFDKKKVFALMDLDAELQDVFFRFSVSTLSELIEGVKRDFASDRRWQCDFTAFRNRPLFYNSDSGLGFTCIAYPFLSEKLASGVYHTILNSWPEGRADRRLFQSYWGKVFEQFANDRLRDAYPDSMLSRRFHPNPFFEKWQSGSYVEISDAVLDYGDALILIEHKGGYLSLEEKYSTDVSKLLNGVKEKFGRGIKQLSRSIARIVPRNNSLREPIGRLDAGGNWQPVLTVSELRRFRRVYPILVIQDFSMTIGFMNRRLRLQFEDALHTLGIDPNVQVRPLSLLTIENLEDILAHIGDLTIPEALDEYSRYDNAPLSTFNEIFRAGLKRRGIQQQRHGWSVKRGEAFINSIMLHFKDTAMN
ncbi:MAG: hypothetical protein ACR2H4_20665 [Pyrinomonadaceae bacterium]